MNNLLLANLMRLWRSWIFWGSAAFMLCAGVAMPVMHYAEGKKFGYILCMENGFYNCSIFAAILISLFCSLFVGTEYSDGTIRNKIIVGHKRRDMYFANLLTNMVVGALLCAVYFIAYLCVGLPLLGFFETNSMMILWLVSIVFMLIFAFCALFTMAAMILSNKAGNVALCILSTVLLLLAGTYMQARLLEPKMFSGYSLSVDGVVEQGEEERNPAYLEGRKREIYQFLYDFLPGGQVVQCSSVTIQNPYRLPVYSAVIFILATSAGIFIFGRKDIR